VRTTLRLTFCLLVATQGYAQVPSLDPSSFSESRISVMNVTGSVRRGLLASPRDSPVDPRSLSVSLPAVSQKKLCVELGSLDGNYHADVTYDVASASGGVYALRIPTAYASELARYRAAELAVLAYASTQCPGPMEFIAPAFWGATTSPSRLTLFLNSGSAATAVSLYDVTTGVTSPCERLKGPNVIAYDTSCPVAVTSHGTRAKLQVQMQFFESRSPTVEVQVYIP
jgi:hypothetical protein